MRYIDYLLTLSVLSGFSLYLLYTGKVELLLSPKLYWMVYLSGFFLGVFIFVLGDRLDIPKSSNASLKKLALGLLYTYPAFLFLVVNPTQLNNVNKPVIKEISHTHKRAKPPGELPTDEEGFVHLNLFELWLLAKNHPESLGNYKFKTAGVVVSDGNTVNLRRSFITCCVADVTPVEVELRNAQGLKEGVWVEVKGRVVLKGHVIIYVESLREVQDKGFISVWSEEPPFNP